MLRLFVLSALCAISMAASLDRRMVPMPDGRIVGGKPTTIEENPWQVSMRNFGSHRCGGSVVSPTKVVTAAHCIRGTSVNSVTVRVGSTFVRDGGDIVDVVRMKEHERYNIPVSINNDIGLLFLGQALVYGPTIQPVGLPNQGERVPTGAVSMISGWGALSQGGPSPNQLQVVAAPIIDDDLCDRAVGIQKDTMVCAGNYENGGIDSCQGDSGGPLTVDGVLHGIVSWGYGCAQPRLPGVYTRAATYRDWVDSNN